MEKRAIFQALVLIFAFLVSVGIYAWSTEKQPDRYNWFDFFRGKPVPTAPAENPSAPLTPPPAPAPATPSAVVPIGTVSSSPLGTRLPGGTLLAQATSPVSPPPTSTAPRARPVDTQEADKVAAANVPAP